MGSRPSISSEINSDTRILCQLPLASEKLLAKINKLHCCRASRSLLHNLTKEILRSPLFQQVKV